MIDAVPERRKWLADRFPVWPELTLSGLHDRIADEFPDRPMILTGQRRISYAEARAASRGFASGLIALGLAPGEHVALVMANGPEFALAKLAIARAGGVAVPINFQLRQDEMRYILMQSDSRYLIAMTAFRDRDYRDDIAGLQRQLPLLRAVIVHGQAHADWLALDAIGGHATPASDAQLLQQEHMARADAMSDIIYTSGTTGRPKGVILTHDMVLRAAYSSALTRAFENGRRIQFALPMYHVFGYVECLVAAMFVGGAIIPHAQFDPPEILDWAERLHSTDIVCVPLMAHRLIETARMQGFASTTLLSIFNSGGTNVPTVWAELREVLGASEIHTAYGMTETTASAVCTRSEDGQARLSDSNGGPKLAGIAGDPALGGGVAQYRVIDPDSGDILGGDRIGELQVRGPIVSPGYYRNSEETRAAFTADGWFKSGDLGRLMDGGFVQLAGRIKEAYRCGGEMVMPREIEDVLAGYPGIVQALAVGVPDTRMGEVGCLCVVALDGVTVSADQLLAHCTRHLARFKVPKYVAMVQADEIPLTVTGRPQRFKLAQLAHDRLGLPA